MFTVEKKDGGQRLVADCRRSNTWLTAAPSTKLFSSSGFAEIDGSEVSELVYGGFDIKHAFYQHSLPMWLRKYFGLPASEPANLESVFLMGCLSPLIVNCILVCRWFPWAGAGRFASCRDCTRVCARRCCPRLAANLLATLSRRGGQKTHASPLSMLTTSSFREWRPSKWI